MKKATIPSNAKLVFKGVIHDVYQWEQEMYDGSVETFEMLKRLGTAVVLATMNGKVLVQKEEQPPDKSFIGFCAGRLEEGESPVDGAKRELLEEAGLATDEIEEWFAINANSKIEHTVHFYIAKNCKKVAEQNLDAGEKIEQLWLTFDEVLEVVERDDFVESLLLPILIKAKYNNEARQDLINKLGL